MSSAISAYTFGVDSPEIFAEVDTIGRPNLYTISRQKSIIGILIPTVPSSATALYARECLSATTFSPSFGGFIADNLALGLNGKILYFSSASSVSYSAMPTLTYFFNHGKGFIPYLDFQVGYVGLSVRGSGLHGLGMGFGAGGVLMLNKHVGVDLGLQYLHSRYPTRYRNVTSNSIATTIGLTTFF